MDFSIRELESLSGIRAHTIRIWEQRYHFLKPSRTQTNIRRYSAEELKTLLTVALLIKNGFKISRIDQMTEEERNSTLLQLEDAGTKQEILFNEMLGYMMDLDAHAFEKALNECIGQYGIEEAIRGPIFHFLEKLGLLWQTNRILPVQEHLVSNIIRQKLIAAIEQLPLVQKEKPLFILFLPEMEHHEMGLLFIYYILRKQNIPVIYLGASLPIKDLEYICQVRRPDYLYIHLTAFPSQVQFQKFIRDVSIIAKDAEIMVSGSLAERYSHMFPSNMIFLPSLQATLDFINSMKAENS